MIDHKILFYSFVDEQTLDLDTATLEDFAYFVQQQDKGRVVSNIGGWQSNNLDPAIPELQPLVTEILKNAERLVLKYDLPKTLKIDPLWMNINGRKDYNQFHEHPHSTISGIFYVKAENACGDLYLVNPITTHQHYIDPSTINNFNEFNCYSYSVSPKPNKLILFPSWVPHFVFPNQSDSDRISIAFNICCGN